ncbi:MAG: formate dehydrogenase accessory sulfurtransferase FdhD, partial [Thermodesulfobacteriota bacterium]|nr:formate dehydrogenase accessory sulfurtransferase FdhD [Thermodesulfobacteriota bacterium]
MYSSFRTYTFSQGKFTSLSSDLILEAPLEIMINGDTNVLIMYTPGMTRELVTGFLFTEGMIDKLDDIEECIITSTEKKNNDRVIEARVTISAGRSKISGIKGSRVSYSSCGICGKDNYYGLKNGLGRVKSKHRFSMKIINLLPNRLIEYQPLYEKTGGAHAAALSDSKGNPLLYSEDMG